MNDVKMNDVNDVKMNDVNDVNDVNDMCVSYKSFVIIHNESLTLTSILTLTLTLS